MIMKATRIKLSWDISILNESGPMNSIWQSHDPLKLAMMLTVKGHRKPHIEKVERAATTSERKVDLPE
jgi:hypothetical protein